MEEMSEKEKVGFSMQGKQQRTYGDIKELWEQELTPCPDAQAEGQQETRWYTNAIKYWAGVDATVDGMLGGFSQVSDPDVKDSHIFLDETFDKLGVKLERKNSCALDCGAGIGRVSKELLLPRYAKVDVLEQEPSFIAQAVKDLTPVNPKGEFFTMGMQSFRAKPAETRYNVIWIQWAAGHLSDEDFLAFLSECSKALSNDGVLVFKENVCGTGFIMDEEDSSITRSELQYTALFVKGGFEVYHTGTQTNFPSELMKVRMWALRPAQSEAMAGAAE